MISLTSPVETAAHGWPAGVKLAALCVATTGLFVIDNAYVMALACSGVLILYALPGWRFMRAGLAGLRVLWPFMVFVALWHGLADTYHHGATIILRMAAVLGLANLVTMTTRLTDMIGVAGWLATPLRRIGVRTRPAEIAIALVVRMIPAHVSRAAVLARGWRARSRRRPSWRMVHPLVLLAFDDAEYIALALRARGGMDEAFCKTGSSGRKSMRP